MAVEILDFKIGLFGICLRLILVVECWRGVLLGCYLLLTFVGWLVLCVFCLYDWLVGN